MAQDFVVLQCCQCHTFQVQMSKKATKWLCKVCNNKQSIKQFFGSGSAKDCRLTVQTLNRQQFEDMDITDSTVDQTIDKQLLDYLMTNDENNDSSDDVSIPKKQKMTEIETKSGSEAILRTNVNQRDSKWNRYLK